MEAQLWAPNNGHRWASCHGQTWAPTSYPHPVPTPSNNGQPLPSTLGIHLYPYWAPNFVHIGSTHLSIMHHHVCPYWKSIFVHNGRPLLAILEAHIRPCRTSTPAQIGSPTIVRGVHACKSGRPKATELGAQYLHVGDRSFPELGVHSLRWPRDLYASGRPTRNVTDRPDLWVPIVARGHAICNTWTRVGKRGRPYLCVGARMERAKKYPTPQRGGSENLCGFNPTG